MMKPILRGDRVTMFNSLLDLASYYRADDPHGAVLIRNAAYALVNGKCLRCPLEYSRGYSAGYKAGVTEWQEVEERAGEREP
jgi:hypothetical protein